VIRFEFIPKDERMVQCYKRNTSWLECSLFCVVYDLCIDSEFKTVLKGIHTRFQSDGMRKGKCLCQILIRQFKFTV